ncbi:MAG: cation transporting ATPase C-terminal domain-containing protein, partial [Nitrosopumilus sp.]|nr:cation transporting ATPase C-terminal domain-containing protein [Nitrosopumilus sp.]
ILFVYFFSLQRGLELAHAQTMAVTTMVFFQFFQVWNSRSEKASIFTMNPFSNKVLFFALLSSVIAHLAVLYVPTLEWLFNMRPLTWMQWVLILSVASTIIVVVEIDKAVRRSRA